MKVPRAEAQQQAPEVRLEQALPALAAEARHKWLLVPAEDQRPKVTWALAGHQILEVEVQILEMVGELPRLVELQMRAEDQMSPVRLEVVEQIQEVEEARQT